MANDDLKMQAEITFSADNLSNVAAFFYSGKLPKLMNDYGLVFEEMAFIMQAIMDKMQEVSEPLGVDVEPEEDDYINDDEVEEDLYETDDEDFDNDDYYEEEEEDND